MHVLCNTKGRLTSQACFCRSAKQGLLTKKEE